MKWVFRENGLDAVRLFAAAQVAILHTWEFMIPEETGSFFFEMLRLFPGVPIFFFISGYLISKSFERSPSIAEYGKNRFLRLYPALVICVLVNLLMVWLTGYFSVSSPSAGDVALLFIAKTTVVQFYNPDFMRAFGDGVLNGSLWTICVEVQFYFLVPILYTLFGAGKTKNISARTLIALIAIFVIANRMLYGLRDEYSESILWKLYRVSFAPWFYMFLVGVLVQRNFDKVASVISRFSGLLMAGVYLLVAFVGTQYLGLSTGNEVSPFLFVFLIPLVIKLAYTKSKQVNSVMKGNDISYGIYIWHMPIVNQMLYLDHRSEHWQALLVVLLTVVIAILSWRYIEKPALGFKKYSLNKQPAASKND
jgi:peptidoglycan/LPS O-acetylase OafA/YrhL